MRSLIRAVSRGLVAVLMGTAVPAHGDALSSSRGSGKIGAPVTSPYRRGKFPQRPPEGSTGSSHGKETSVPIWNPSGRLILIKPKGFVHAGSYSVPGYYTLILFSATWCIPCSSLRERLPGLLRKYPNLAIIDLDVTGKDGVNPESSAILTDLSAESPLPAALFFNPFGLYINKQDPSGIASAITGADDILRRIDRALKKRKYSKPLPLDNKSIIEKLYHFQARNDHYVLARKKVKQDKPQL